MCSVAFFGKPFNAFCVLYEIVVLIDQRQLKFDFVNNNDDDDDDNDDNNNNNRLRQYEFSSFEDEAANI